MRELGERENSADVLRELTQLTEAVELKASPEVSTSHAPPRDHDIDVTSAFNDRSCTYPPGTADEPDRGNEVLEAALVAFRGEKRRAGRAHRVLRTTTKERSRVSMHCDFFETFNLLGKRVA